MSCRGNGSSTFSKILFLGKVLFYESEKNENERFINAAVPRVKREYQCDRYMYLPHKVVS